MVEAEDILGIKLVHLIKGATDVHGSNIAYSGTCQLREYTTKWVTITTPIGDFSVYNGYLEKIELTVNWLEIFGFFAFPLGIYRKEDFSVRSKDGKLLGLYYKEVLLKEDINEWGLHDLQNVYYSITKEVLRPIKSIMA